MTLSKDDGALGVVKDGLKAVAKANTRHAANRVSSEGQKRGYKQLLDTFILNARRLLGGAKKGASVAQDMAFMTSCMSQLFTPMFRKSSSWIIILY